MEHEVVRARCGPGLGAVAELAERHPCEVVEAVVRLVRQDEGGDAGVDRKVLLVVAVRGGEDRAALDEQVVQLVAQDVLVRVRVRGTGRGRGRGRGRIRVRVRVVASVVARVDARLVVWVRVRVTARVRSRGW